MHPRNREVQDALDLAGTGSRLVVPDEHARTAVLAAEQVRSARTCAPTGRCGQPAGRPTRCSR